jgi:hypothetical protein
MKFIYIAIVFLICFIILKIFTMKNKTSDISSNDSKNVLAGLNRLTFKFNNSSNIEEGEKMCYSPILKNTIMSLEDLTSIREGLFYITVGDGQHLLSRKRDSSHFGSIPLWSNLESSRQRFINSDSAITDYYSGDQRYAIPFLLTFISSDLTNPNNKIYTFDIRDFTGAVYNYNQYKKLGLFDVKSTTGKSLYTGLTTIDSKDHASILTVIVRDNKTLMRFNDQFLYVWNISSTNNYQGTVKLIWGDPVKGTFSTWCGLVPVLNKEIAYDYLIASIDFIDDKNISSRQTYLNTVKDNIAEPFCGTKIKFKDGTSKLDVGVPDRMSDNIVTRAFERICACNMDTKPTGYYTNSLCSDKFIKDNYGIDNSPDGSKYNMIRSNLKCNLPNCTYQKCNKVYEEPKQLSILYTDNPFTECGADTICIINQKFDNFGTIIGGTINIEADSKCAGNTIEEEVLPLSWI